MSIKLFGGWLTSYPIASSPRLTPRPALPAPGHILALDGVRGLAILLVLLYHGTMGMRGQDYFSRLILKATGVGWCGVDLFFVLSGFLITGILTDAKATRARFRNFYARRALRIFPLYYATIAAVYFGLPTLTRYVGGFEGIEGSWAWLSCYGTNILVAERESWFPLSHLWSLAVEEHFYLFWPAVVFWCDRKTAARACLALVLLAVVVRACLVANGLVLAAYCLTVSRMDALLIGGSVALAARGPGGLAAMIGPARVVAKLAALGLVGLIGWRFGLPLHDAAVQTVGYLLLDVFFAAMLILVIAAPPDAPLAVAFRLAPLRSLGRYSYGLYVYNSIVVMIFDGLDLHPRLIAGAGALGNMLFLILGGAATFAAAGISWHLFEKHFLKFKRYFAHDPQTIYSISNRQALARPLAAIAPCPGG